MFIRGSIKNLKKDSDISKIPPPTTTKNNNNTNSKDDDSDDDDDDKKPQTTMTMTTTLKTEILTLVSRGTALFGRIC